MNLKAHVDQTIKPNRWDRAVAKYFICSDVKDGRASCGCAEGQGPLIWMGALSPHDADALVGAFGL